MFSSTGALVVRFIPFLLLVLQHALAHETSTTTILLTSTSTWTTTITLSGSVIRSVETKTLASTASPTGEAAYSGSAFESAVLNSTNYYRAHHQAGPLTWNATLASFAQDYAQRCIWAHSGGPYGENLAMNFADPTLAVDAWGDEESLYNYEKPTFSEATGHFTQLVWQGSTSVGCGAVQCNNSAANGAKGWMLVCEYTPAGNVIGSFRQNVGKPGISADGVLGFASSAGSRSICGKRLAAALAVAYAALAALA